MLEPSAAMDEAAGAQASLSPILNGPASIQQQQEYRFVWPQCSIAYQDAWSVLEASRPADNRLAAGVADLWSRARSC